MNTLPPSDISLKTLYLQQAKIVKRVVEYQRGVEERYELFNHHFNAVFHYNFAKKK